MLIVLYFVVILLLIIFKSSFNHIVFVYCTVCSLVGLIICVGKQVIINTIVVVIIFLLNSAY